MAYRVLRVYHGGRDPAHRARDRALAAAGHEVTLVVPSAWPEVERMHPEPFEVVELPVHRAGDVNRHTFTEPGRVRALLRRVRPDVVDLHGEPFASATHQVLGLVGPDVPVVGYTAQNIDKRLPPPFAHRETRALAGLAGMYPCSRQAASVARGKGFAGPVSVIPLGVDTAVFVPGDQRADDDVFTLGIVGRLVPHKGILDAVAAVAAVARVRPARLLVVGDGPELAPARALAGQLGVTVGFHPWVDVDGLARLYRRMHVVVVPSRATRTWVEQFGRVVGEARACGAVVVATASGSLPDVVGPTGVVVPSGADLPGAVADLAADPCRWEALRAAGTAGVTTWADVAAAQGVLYATARRGDAVAQPAGRGAAWAEFGPPAAVAGGGRPFALPVLREDTAVTRLLARSVDGVLAR